MEIKLRKLFQKDFKNIEKNSYFSYDLSYPEYNKNFKLKNYVKNNNKRKTINLSKENEQNLFIIDKICNNSQYRILTFFENIDIKILEEKFKSKAEIIYLKYITLNSNSFNPFIYQLYSNRGFRTLNQLNSFCERIGISGKYNLTILVINPINLKVKLNTVYPHIKQYITTNFLETVEISKLYFNQNSINFLENQNLENFMSFKFWKSRVMFQTIRKWIYKNLLLEEQEDILFFSSIVLYIYGLRNCGDIDLLIYKNINKFDEKSNSLINRDFIEKNLFFFLDISIKGTIKWKDYWKFWLNEWANLCNLDSFDNIIYDPNNYFYFMGMKIISLDIDIVRRLKRNRPRALVDLYIIKKFIKPNMLLPNIPTKEEVFIKLENLTEEEIREILLNNGKHHRNCKELIIYDDINKEKFLNTMIWCFKVRYGIIISKEKLEKIFKPKKKKIKILKK